MAPPPASLHEESEAPERLDSPPKSFAKVTLELPSEPNGLPNNHPGTQNDSRNYKAVQSPGEYEGAGILDAPPSPTRGHKRLSSRSSRSSLRGAKTLKKNGSSDEKAEAVVYEKHEDGNGGQLTSVKPTEDYEKNLKTDEKEYKPITNGKKEEKSSKGEQELELTSGRVASAGWEKSGYVVQCAYACGRLLTWIVFVLRLSMCLLSVACRLALSCSILFRSQSH